ncbi:MAG: DoxX family protein [Flammeovirgaceae bacterium]|nr:DoxX family protein [Flammeovirgaceae bacterium]
MDFLIINLSDLLKGETSAQVLTSTLLAILFLQSGMDKVFDWKGNFDWLKGHFEKSPLKGQVPILLFVITIFEISAGLLSAIGVIFILFTESSGLALIGAQLSALSIVMLFFGQRLAKDYEGAATLVPYFILAILGILILG